MAKKQKVIDYDYLSEVINDQSLETPLKETSCRPTVKVQMERKDVGLNVLHHWNVGLNDPRTKLWSDAVIKQINESSNAIVFATDFFTEINSNTPSDCDSYEKQIAFVIKQLRKIEKPVILWPGAVERRIYKRTEIDLLSLAYDYLKDYPNIQLIESLEKTKDTLAESVLFDVALKTDFVQNPYIRVEIHDSNTRSRNVRAMNNKVRRTAHQQISDVIVDLSIQQNARIYPNILCYGPMCSIDLANKASKVPMVLNDSYVKLEVEKENTDRGYKINAYQNNYSFDKKKEAHLDKINITANTIVEKLGNYEKDVIEEMYKYLDKTMKDIDKERYKEVQNALRKNKEAAHRRAKAIPKSETKETKNVEEKVEKQAEVEEPVQ